MKHLLILLSFLLLSSPLFGQETGVLYLYETSSGKKWKTFGDGKVQPKYKGDIKNGKPNGQGTLTLPNGFNYVGEWKDGKKNGQGTVTNSDGEKYVGEFNHAKLKRKQKYLNNESRMLTNKCVNSHLNNCTLTNYKQHPVFSDFY